MAQAPRVFAILLMPRLKETIGGKIFQVERAYNKNENIVLTIILGGKQLQEFCLYVLSLRGAQPFQIEKPVNMKQAEQMMDSVIS